MPTSSDSVPAPNGHYKPLPLIDENLSIREVFGDGYLRVDGPPLPTPPRATAPTKKRRPPRKSGLYVMLHAAQQHGFTHPDEGFWTMLPKEYDAILALEHKAVAQVVLEVLRQTIGTPAYGQHGNARRREWAPLSVRHFLRAGLSSRSQAEMGIKQALGKGYIMRRPLGAGGFEYAIRWRGTN